jgi:hypothetical protein
MSKTDAKLVGEVCLYGNGQMGAGYIATLPDRRMFGDGEPVEGLSMNDAYWLGCLDLKEAGAGPGLVRVYMAGGRRVADADISNPPYFGELRWVLAEVFTISFDDIVAAAESDKL